MFFGECLRTLRRFAGGNLRVLNRKGVDSMERIIKLVKAVTELLRVVAEIIRLFKMR